MTASAILSVPGVAVVAAASVPGVGPVTGDAGAFGALLQQQLPQPDGNPQAPDQTQPLTAEPLPTDSGEGVSTPAMDAPLPEMESPHVLDVPVTPVRPAPSSGTADKVASGDAPPVVGDEILPAADTALRSDAEIPELLVPEEPSVEAADMDAPSVDETVADAPDGTATPPMLVQQHPPAQPAGPAVAAASALSDAPTDKVAQDEAVVRVGPDVSETRGPDRSGALMAKAQEPTKGEGPSAATPASQPALAAGNTALADAVPAESGDNGLSSPLLTQTLPAISPKPAGSPYPPAAAQHQPVVKAEPGTIGGNVGMEIAKVAKAGRDDLLIRLDPREMGRVDVRLSFDNDGVLRAVLSADSPAALDMLRRESGDLNRALADAGVRADAQSLRFDARSGGQGMGSGEGSQRDQPHSAPQSRGLADEGALDLPDPVYRPLNASGHVDLMA